MNATTPSTALVLGGGGAVGVGWQAGLLAGFAREGHDFADVDLVVGTSAGSIVAALFASGKQPTDAFDTVERFSAAVTAEQLRGGSQALLTAMAEVGLGDDSGPALRRIGSLAAAQNTPLDEPTFLTMFEDLRDLAWPEVLRTTAIDIETGDLRVWGPDDVELIRGVASSCAGPIIFPPVTIHGRRYMDGGVKSHLNVAPAAGAERILALSCFPLDLPPESVDQGLAAALKTVCQEIDDIRATGAVIEVVEPNLELLALAGGEGNMMNTQLAQPAYDIGLRQAEQTLPRIAAWQG
ncbi:patatin-like phospholipase family protein [Streptomyces chartreusis]